MQQTPVHEHSNPDLLRMLPDSVSRVIEIGCSAGALARDVLARSPSCHYVGVEIDEDYATLARRHCHHVEVLNLDMADSGFFDRYADRDCWVFGDVLEHLRDPWRVLREIRRVLPANGCVVACIPNAQHWSLQVRLSVGDFRYEDQGLLDRTHLRWFTRQTIVELFVSCGFRIETGQPRIFNEARRGDFLPLIGKLAAAAGADPQLAMQDAMALQYVIRARPAAPPA